MAAESSQSPLLELDTDAVIVGGGVAGLWLLRLLKKEGYHAVLLEQSRLGGVQTLASQGMIHGGLKYTLTGSLTPASAAAADMPGVWRDCLAGNGALDLSGLTPVADCSHLFATGGSLDRLTSFFASKALAGRVSRVQPGALPAVFEQKGFSGVVYRLNEFVLDVPGLLRRLLHGVADQTYRWSLQADHVEPDPLGGMTLRLDNIRITTTTLVLTAGAGTQTLLNGMNIHEPRQQLRPLQQVLVRHDHPYPLFAHCLTGVRSAEPRLTITSHRDGDKWLWYLGGRLAERGAGLDAAVLCALARDELDECVPWLDWRGAAFDTLEVDRAEPAQTAGHRPDQPFAMQVGNVIVCWPTKLTLTPELGSQVLALLPSPDHGPSESDVHLDRLPLPRPELGDVPWAR